MYFLDFQNQLHLDLLQFWDYGEDTNIAMRQTPDHRALHDDANQRRDEEGGGHRGRQVPVDVIRKPGAEQALHGVGGIGADHQQFAMRHVDDAHDAIGDGQPECSQQQDATERQAGKDAAEVFGNRQPAVDGLDCGDGLVAHLVV